MLCSQWFKVCVHMYIIKIHQQYFDSTVGGSVGVCACSKSAFVLENRMLWMESILQWSTHKCHMHFPFQLRKIDVFLGFLCSFCHFSVASVHFFLVRLKCSFDACRAMPGHVWNVCIRYQSYDGRGRCYEPLLMHFTKYTKWFQRW